MLKRREFLSLTPRARPAQDAYWLHVSCAAMACRFEVTVPRRETTGVRVANAALDEAGKLEQQLSVFRETSEVSYINRNAASHPIRVDSSLWKLLILCFELHRESDGAFDVTSAPLSRCWGLLRRQGRIPGSNEIEGTLAVVGSEKLRFDHNARTIRFERTGVELAKRYCEANFHYFINTHLQVGVRASLDAQPFQRFRAADCKNR